MLLPHISIVTPSYNQSEYLEECIDSVLSQGYPNLEYVIMDGGSTDGSVEIIKKYSKYLTYWHSEKDAGQYAAINEGFTHTTGEIMAWLNSDDRYHSNAFLKVATAFSLNSDVNWITGRRTIIDKDSDIVAIDSFTPSFSKKKLLSGNFANPPIMQEATFWRRCLWEEAGGRLDTRFTLAADTELWIRFFRYSRLYILDAFTGMFRHHGDQRSLNNIKKYHEEVNQALLNEISTYNIEFSTAAPKPIFIPSNIYIDYADYFSIPRYIYSSNKKSFQNLFVEWMLACKGGLESALFFYNEVELWLETDDRNRLLDELRKFIQLKQQAQDIIKKSEKYFCSGDLKKALQKAEEASEIWKTSAEATNNLGVICYKQGKIKEAIEHFVQCTNFDVSMSEAYRNLAIIFHAAGDYDKVKWALDYYLSWFPDDAEMEDFYRRLMEWRS